ncbi:hypothetical protein PWT90_10961 [Aphanocladium album]|nr:hypothetical protein PWT90_10961 [Aphanocladium album]
MRSIFCALLILLTGASALQHDRLFNHPAIGISRRDGIGSTNLTLKANSSLAESLELVEAAQAEARSRNARLLGSPRRNKYELRSASASLSGPASYLKENGTVQYSTYDGTGVNGTVSAALSLVAEAFGANMTAPSNRLEKRGGYWMEQMVQNGASPFAPSGYKVWRNVKDYGAVGDGVHDDTTAINRAISDGNRCGADCGSSTTLQAAVYFPAGTYLVSRSIVAYYFTQMIGDATNPPIIKVAPSFVGLGVISSDVYIDGGNGASWYINQNNFYRQVRNFVIDMTAGPAHDYIAGIHW